MTGPAADVEIVTELHLTEDPAKVTEAVRRLFPDAEVEAGDGYIRARTGDLTRVKELVEDQEIQDTARTQLRHGRTGDRLTVTLSKQAAYAGALNFAVGDSPLGDLDVTVRAEDLDLVIERVAPTTEAGEVGEDEGGSATGPD